MNEIGPPQNKEEFAQRLANRMAEVIALAEGSRRENEFPKWVINVMRVLKEQLVPEEIRSVLAPGASAYGDGVGIGISTQYREIISGADSGAILAGTRMVEAITTAPPETVEQLASGQGNPAAAPEIERVVMTRLFAESLEERKLFAEGLLVGMRLQELVGGRSGTDATSVYLMLWLYWPEVTKLYSIGEVATSLEWSIAENTRPGWPDRFRKIANRIKLSYKAKQRRKKKHPAE